MNSCMRGSSSPQLTIYLLQILFVFMQMVSSSEAPTNKTPTKEQEELIKLLNRMDVPRFGGPGAAYFPPPPPPRPIRPPSCRYWYNGYFPFVYHTNPINSIFVYLHETLRNHP